MIRAIAIDDEPIALQIIERHAEKVPYLRLAHVFTNAFEAIDFLRNESVDLIFLDINMPDISGLEFLKSLTAKPHIIFTTAYSEYAVESYEHGAIDYLLKPFDFGRFLKAVNRVAEQFKQQNETYIFLKTGFDYIRLEVKDILYTKAEGNYVKFVTADQSIMSRMKMKEVEAALDDQLFVKVHRSYIVNRSAINKIEKHQVHIGQELIPVSQTYYEELISQL
ncbi:MAG: LytTR family DNA-binding domain-containing protein [Roseivirga sp.]